MEGCPGEDHEIISISENSDAMFSAISGVVAPITSAGREVKRAHLAVTRLIDKIEELPREEIESFLDALTDLVRDDVTLEEVEGVVKRLRELDRIGEVLSEIMRSIERLEEGQRRTFMAASIRETIKGLKKMHDDVAVEALGAEDDFGFEYLLVTQTIILKCVQSLESALDSLVAGREADQTVFRALHLAFYGLIRVEAFRRGKIDIRGLHNTLSYLVERVRTERPPFSISVLNPEAWSSRT